MTTDQQQPSTATSFPATTGPADEPASREELEWVWCLAGNSYPQDVWLRLWRALGDRSLRPREPIAAYRAAFPGGERGMSWAPNRADAEHYARLQSARRIYRTTLRPSAVVGIVSSTGEIVVDPRRLGRVVDVTDSTEGTPRAEQRRAEADQQRSAAEQARERGRARRQAERDVLERWVGRARARSISRGQQQDRTPRPSPSDRAEQMAVQRGTQAALDRAQAYLAQLEQDHAATLAEIEQLEQDRAADLAQREQDQAATLAELEALAATDPQDVIRQAVLARQRQTEQEAAP